MQWIFFFKSRKFGIFIRFKERLVAQDCRQIREVDVDDVFAPISSFRAKNALLAVAAAKNF